jgi:hypothetical protein
VGGYLGSLVEVVIGTGRSCGGEAWEGRLGSVGFGVGLGCRLGM